MKLSNNLLRDITSAIIVERNRMTDLIDSKFRSDIIDHDTWVELFQGVNNGANRIQQEILSKIENYSGKR